MKLIGSILLSILFFADTHAEHYPFELVDVAQAIPNIKIDLIYGTPHNLTGKPVYDFTVCLLVKDAAHQLKKVQLELEAMGLGLKIWDGFRPMAVQWKLWEILPDERFVSDPRKGGRHTRGTAVDLTIVDKDGNELLMPTGFDDFTEKAHSNYNGASTEAILNRELLKQIMHRHGFTVYPSEWWHYDLINWQNYPVLDFTPN